MIICYYNCVLEIKFNLGLQNKQAVKIMLVWETETCLLAPSSSLAQNTFETPFQRLDPKESIAMFYKNPWIVSDWLLFTRESSNPAWANGRRTRVSVEQRIALRHQSRIFRLQSCKSPSEGGFERQREKPVIRG